MPPSSITPGSGYLLYFGSGTDSIQVKSASVDLLLETSSGTGLLWTIATNGGSEFYSLCTTRGAGSYCLDILNNDKDGVQSRTVPHLSQPSYASGQQWSFSFSPSGGYRLFNQFTGSGWYLGVQSDDKQLYMTNNLTESLGWTIKNSTDTTKPSSTVQSITSYTISSSSSTTVAPTTLITSTSASTLAPGLNLSAATASSAEGSAIAATQSSIASASSSEVLSTGAKVGIGVGAAAIVLIILGLSFALLMARRRARRDPSRSMSNEPGNDGSAGVYAKVELCGMDQRTELDGQGRIAELYGQDKAPGELYGSEKSPLEMHGQELSSRPKESVVHVAELPAR